MIARFVATADSGVFVDFAEMAYFGVDYPLNPSADSAGFVVVLAAAGAAIAAGRAPDWIYSIHPQGFASGHFYMLRCFFRNPASGNRYDLDHDDILIYEIPLLVETGAAEKFDYVITVESDIDLRKARLLKKGLYISQIEKRMASQASEEARIAVADSVIRNDGDEDSLLRQVENLWESVLVPQSLG